MIAYDLHCSNGHAFEGWFEDDKTYRAQQRKAMVSCPVCNSADVHRVPSTFAIKSSNRASTGGPKIDPERLTRKIVDFVEKNFDNVGPDFAKEALKIHYGASEPRNIRGTSTDEEEKVLEKEGVGFIKVPVPVTQQKTDS
jgi:hypothetical protein